MKNHRLSISILDYGYTSCYSIAEAVASVSVLSLWVGARAQRGASQTEVLEYSSAAARKLPLPMNASVCWTRSIIQSTHS